MNALTLIYNNIQLLADKTAISFRKDGEWKSLTWSEFGKELAKTINALKSFGGFSDTNVRGDFCSNLCYQ